MREYRFRIATAGATDVEGNVALEAVLARAPIVTGRIVHPTTGRAEMRPFRVEAIDASGALTAEFTAAGRWTAIGRLCDVGFRDVQLANPGFEAGSLTGWSTTASGGSWSASQVAPRSGLWSAAYDTTGQTANARITQTFPSEPGQRWTPKIWARAATASPTKQARVRLEWLDAGGASIGNTEGDAVTLATAYQLLTVDGIAPAGTAQVQFRYVVIDSTGDNTVYFDDASEWRTYGTGRVSMVDEGSGPGKYIVEVSDESWIARRTPIFTEADTVQVWPPGVRAEWRGFSAAEQATGDQVVTLNTNTNLKRIRLAHDSRVVDAFVNYVGELLTSDPTPLRQATGSTNNFGPLRLRYDNINYWIVSFQSDPDSADYLESLNSDAARSPSPDQPSRIRVWVHSTQAIPENEVGHLFLEGEPPSRDVPLHIGIADPTHAYGTTDGFIHPATLTRRIWDELGVRYDDASLTALEADTSYPLLAPRVTEQVTNPEEWLSANVWAPLMMVALTAGDGRRKLVDLRLPQDLDPGTLPILDASNTAANTWTLTGRDAANSIAWKYLSVTRAAADVRRAKRKGSGPTDAPEVQLDGFRVEERETSPIEGDTIGTIGHRNLDLSLLGALEPTADQDRRRRVVAAGGALWDGATGEMSRELLDIFQDGAYRFRGEVGRSVAETLEEGDLVLIDLGSLQLPNPVSGARSDLRLVRAMSITRHPAHAEVEFLDLGPDAQPLAAPTVQIFWSGSTPGEVDVTLSDIPVGATAELQLAYTGSSAEPTKWPIRRAGLGNGSYVFLGVPAAGWAHARARSTAPGRIRSVWALDSVSIGDRAAILNAAIVLDDSGIPTIVVEASSATQRIEYAADIHDPGEDPTFGSPISEPIGNFPLTLGVEVPGSQRITLELTPFDAPVGGIAGETVTVSTDRSPVTLQLAMAVEVDLSVPGEAELTVRVADPSPGRDITISYTADGPVTPASPQMLSGSAVTSDLETTGSVVFTADLDAGASVVRFVASAPGRAKVSQTVTMGIKGPPGTPGVAGRIRILSFGGEVTTDATIEVQHDTGESGELFVWVNPSGVSTPDYINDPPDGSVVFGSTPFVADDATSFSLTGGGNGTLLNDIPVIATQLKTIFARAEFDDGTVAEAQHDLEGIIQIDDPFGVLVSSDPNGIVGSLALKLVTNPNVGERAIAFRNLVVGSYDNLISDPSFEAAGVFGTEGVSATDRLLQAGWGQVTDAGGTWSTTTTNPFAGTYAAIYTRSGQTSEAILGAGAGGPSTNPAVIAAKEGDKHYLQARARMSGAGSGGQGRIDIVYRDAAGAIIATNLSSTVNLTFSYQTIAIESGAAPAGTSSVQFRLRVLDAGTVANVLWDDCFARLMVDGTLIVDGAILAKHLSAGSVTTVALAARAARIQNLSIGSLGNMIPDPIFSSGDLAESDWTVANPEAGGTWSIGTGSPRIGTFSARYDRGGQTNTSRLRHALNGMECAPDDEFYFRAYLGTTGGSGNGGVAIRFRDASGVTTGNFTSTGSLTTAYALFDRAAIAPANSVGVEFEIVVNNSGTATVIKADDCYAQKKVDGNLVVDGSITAQHINVVTLDAISANVGVLTAGVIQNSTGTGMLTLDTLSVPTALNFLRLNATGTDILLGSRATAGGSDYNFFLRADGEVFIGGNATFEGTLNGADGTFAGTVAASAIVASDTFTAATANFDGTVAVGASLLLSSPNLSASSIGVGGSSTLSITGSVVDLNPSAALRFFGQQVTFGANNSGDSPNTRMVQVPNA